MNGGKEERRIEDGLSNSGPFFKITKREGDTVIRTFRMILLVYNNLTLDRGINYLWFCIYVFV